MSECGEPGTHYISANADPHERIGEDISEEQPLQATLQLDLHDLDDLGRERHVHIIGTDRRDAVNNIHA